MSLPKLVCLACYYLVAIHLPDNMLFIKWGGVRVRRMLCSHIFKKCGKGVMIHKGANFGSGLDIEIGDHSDIGVNAVIPSNTIIGNDVLMAPNCYIFGCNHRFDNVNMPIRTQGATTKKQTVIGDDVWIGRNVTMMPGRSIQKGSIIGACCVLTKDFPPYSIVGGNPSRLLKSRLN